MTIDILERAEEDLVSGYRFYEKQSPGLGSYFLDTLYAEIESLRLYAGTHRTVHGSNRCLSRRFPYSIYYRVEGDIIRVRAVLDNRRRPSRIISILKRD